MIKVIDLFAGPGGLGEGFSVTGIKPGERNFDVALSIEKDKQAHETLQLRTFVRHFESPPQAYYQFLRGEITRDALYQAFLPEARSASRKCWNATLGPGGEDHDSVRDRIKEALGSDETWVLIGGPPCQAYSLAGRSRNVGNVEYDPLNDTRQKLYIEYLHVLAEHRPTVFIMENVKGLLSATLSNEYVFSRIIEDLQNPAKALKREGRPEKFISKGEYRIYSLLNPCNLADSALEHSVISAENHGIPQARHRIILLGIRDDIDDSKIGSLITQQPIIAAQVLEGLPGLRSGISPKNADSASAWARRLKSQVNSRWANAGTRKVDSEKLSELIRLKLQQINPPAADRGAEFIEAEVTANYAPEWYCDDKIGGVCNHSSRAHMEKDLFRYFYSACYAELYGQSPSLRNFPTDLLPSHSSVSKALENGGYFSDRFRVQLYSKPSTTIVSHISKDGHYYIHPDPMQCRSLTVREAARLQTFPDNYFFCGSRTSQYTQVGNAVPPLLAKQIAEIVLNILKD
ncbi:DNA cytosine methyltransferase [Desulfurispirillum indicum]|uniref:DNA cytosine methyltransferase n=1 Tax=Desulfurispirillum indicum TaxID=936456 RepID=UPI001CFA2F07|nr:DNA cytosine methyltransferase [Desulfurispirillum indicum]UCZ56861.1 DNA cytosine methyltransferase [Desulfurispirillum indicum]